MKKLLRRIFLDGIGLAPSFGVVLSVSSMFVSALALAITFMGVPSFGIWLSIYAVGMSTIGLIMIFNDI